MSPSPVRARALVEEMIAVCQVGEVGENELLPHVLLAFDPEQCESKTPWMGCGSSCVGLYPDLHAALAVASQWEATLNRGSGPGDIPFRVLVLAVHPPIKDSP